MNERKVIEVEPVENNREESEYYALKIDINRGYIMTQEALNRFKELEKKYGE